MSSYFSILDTTGALLLLIAALILLMGQTLVLMLFLPEKQNWRHTAAAGLHLLIGFLVFVNMLDSYGIVNDDSFPRRSIIYPFLFFLPWLFYVMAEVLSAGILTFQLLAYTRYRKNTVTSGAIRQTVDLLPEGICISAPDGTVRLSNLTMDALCRELTGERPADVHRLRARLEADGEDQSGKRLIRTSRGEVWLFSKGAITVDGKAYDRTSAVNVTERYHITEELRKKNVHLKEIQRRMKEAAQLSSEMFVKQEAAAARAALHNELGQVLLMGRRYIEHPESTDAATVALMTRQMNRFLLGESEAPEPDAGDEISRAVDMAGSIGVSVDMMGEPPAQDVPRSILAAAIRECAANAVKHAGGDRIFVQVVKTAAGTELTVANNGRPPKGPIAESGGLLSLRRRVEAAGGRMLVQSAPAFSLTLSFADQ